MMNIWYKHEESFKSKFMEEPGAWSGFPFTTDFPGEHGTGCKIWTPIDQQFFSQDHVINAIPYALMYPKIEQQKLGLIKYLSETIWVRFIFIWTCWASSFWRTQPDRLATWSSRLSDLNQSAATNCIIGFPAFTCNNPYVELSKH
jgi:hypothetical protein